MNNLRKISVSPSEIWVKLINVNRMYIRAEAMSGGEDELGVKYRAAANVRVQERDTGHPREFPGRGILAADDSRQSPPPGRALAARNVCHCKKER